MKNRNSRGDERKQRRNPRRFSSSKGLAVAVLHIQILSCYRFSNSSPDKLCYILRAYHVNILRGEDHGSRLPERSGLMLKHAIKVDAGAERESGHGGRVARSAYIHGYARGGRNDQCRGFQATSKRSSTGHCIKPLRQSSHELLVVDERMRKVRRERVAVGSATGKKNQPHFTRIARVVVTSLLIRCFQLKGLR